tara:strand:- start:37 stop:1887 length:1851 start_codon:yes stop_codon:yes gene_type:complete
MAATLDSVIGQLKTNNAEQAKTTAATNATNNAIRDFIEEQRLQRLKDLENQREMMKKMGTAGVGGGSTKSTSAQEETKKGPFQLPAWAQGIMGGVGLGLALSLMKKLLASLKFLTLGLVALEAAALGFRGWEGAALTKLEGLVKGVGSISNKIATFIDDAVRAGLKFIGVDEFKRGKDGKPLQNRTPGGKFDYGKQLKSTKEMLAKLFGLADDAPEGAAGQKAGGMFAKMREIVKSLFSPIARFIDAGVDLGKTFLSGVPAVVKLIGGTTLAALAAFGKSGFMKVLNKFLWPIGIIFSGYQAVQDWLDTADGDMSFDERVASALSTFVANFIGAPLDLLKKGLTWIYKKVFGLESDENGKIKEGQGLSGKVGIALQNFSFEEFIKSALTGMYDVAKAVFTGIVSFLKDPKTFVTEAYQEFLERNDADSIGGLIKNKVTGFADALFGWIPSLEDMKDMVLDQLRSVLPESVQEFLGIKKVIPKRPEEIAAEKEAAKKQKQMIANRAFLPLGNDMMMKMIDKNADGMVNMEEFLKYYRHSGTNEYIKYGGGNELDTFLKVAEPDQYKRNMMVMDFVEALRRAGPGGGVMYNDQSVTSTSPLAISTGGNAYDLSDVYSN